MNATETQNISLSQPRYLWFLMLCFSMVILYSNWFAPRLIHIFGVNTDAATIIFPLTFLLSDLITEVYGYKHARRAIWCGFLFNFIFIAYGQLVIHMPSPPYPTHNALFDKLLSLDTRIIIASACSYLCSEPFNSFIMAKLKIKLKCKMMGTRFVLSTMVAAAVDSVIFGAIGFYGLMTNSNLVSLIVTMWFIKIIIEVIGLPMSVYLAIRLKRAEQMDMYDEHTKFNVFSIEANYQSEDNQY